MKENHRKALIVIRPSTADLQVLQTPPAPSLEITVQLKASCSHDNKPPASDRSIASGLLPPAGVEVD